MIRTSAILVSFVLIFCSIEAGQPAQTPVFSSRTWLVPVDVRVVDSGGRPITGLRESEFTITEDRVPQRIAHFAEHSLTAEPAAAATALRRGDDTADKLAPANRRTFLIVMGRGRLQPPSKGVDAALTFVRDRLLPQDQVAVFAWNRATDFSTDRARIGAVLERFRIDHERIEALLRQHFSGFSAIYKGSGVPDFLQKDIDRVFQDPAAPPMRELVPGRASDAAQINDDAQQAMAAAQRVALLKERAQSLAAIGKSLSSFDQVELERSTAGQWMADVGALSPLALSMDDYVGEGRRLLGELSRLYSAIDYLRFVEGEKHVIYITEQGFLLPRVESDLSLAAAANQARVTLNIVQTGGIPSPSLPASSSEALQAPPIGAALPQMLVVGSIRSLAELTGGVASVYDFADKAMTRVVQATSSGYLLGYYPTNTALDGRFRRVQITVNRKGATVLYRHGYFAEQPRTPLNRRQAITYARIASAVNYAGSLNDLPFRLRTRSERGTNRVDDLIAEITLDPARMTFIESNGQHLAEVDVAVLCQTRNDEPTGDAWQRVHIRLSPAEFATAQRAGVTLNIRVPVRATVFSVKAIAYDFVSDRLGSATMKVR